MEIPEDLRAFLACPENRTLALPGCQVGAVTLFAPEELAAATHDIGTDDFALQERWEGRERMAHRKYWFRGVDLIKACRNYHPTGIFVWFQELGVYGQWDCDHHKIIVYPGASWSDILKNPARYFDGMWEPNRVHHEYLWPWKSGAEPGAVADRPRE